jgi:hypothetical protein
MISHKHKFIFIHIPKCAGSSIRDFYFDKPNLDWKTPNYDLLYGWCPKRKFHLQHATAKQLLETGLISSKVWDNYYKFTFVRNPWDRAYSAYLWIMRDCKINGAFMDFILRKGVFKDLLTNQEMKSTRSCHTWPQTDFFTIKGSYDLDYVGRFETLQEDIKFINNHLNIKKQFKQHSNKSHKRAKHYSLFYEKTNQRLVESLYNNDIELLKYSFENKKSGIQLFKDFFKMKEDK